MDVNTAFLNADLKEEVYMEQPEGFQQDSDRLVCLLIKALYGTHQAPREWNELFSSCIIIKLDFKQSVLEPCLFFKQSRTNRLMIIVIFVDDMQSAYHHDDEKEWLELKAILMKEFDMTDMGESEWILGMRITRDRARREIYLDQELYVKKVLEKFGMMNAKSVSTPEDQSKVLDMRLVKVTGPEDQKFIKKYQAVVGSLLYAAITTRIDLGHAVQQLSKYLSNPQQEHWVAAQRVLRYLNGATNWKLCYKGTPGVNLVIESFTDANYAMDREDRKSVTGIVVKLNGDVVSWSSKKQKSPATSTTEAEYIAMSGGTKEVLWMRHLLKEIGLKVEHQSTIHCDNQGALAISHNNMHHDDTKHIDVHYHFVRHHINEDSIKTVWVPTEHQEADILTKGLERIRFQELRESLMSQ